MFEASLQGLYSILQADTLALMALGVFLGSTVGFLPGIGGPAMVAMLLPFTFTLSPAAAIALLISIDAVGNTANTFPSVLISIPGGAGSQATILDGYPMAKKGEAARALSAAFTASLCGGIFGALILTASIPIVRPLVLSFGFAEFFMLTVLGMSMVAVLSGGAPLKGIVAGCLGILLSTVGPDIKSGVPRFVFGQTYLIDNGVSLVILALGIFGVSEVIDLAVRKTSIAEARELGSGWTEGVKDCLRHWWLLVRSAAVGAWVGFLPGLGSSVADWFAYAAAAQTEKDAERFGQGDVRGVIAPEASNNAKEGGGYIPTLAFGIPGGTTAALVLVGLVAVGIRPGPSMLTHQLDLTFAIIWTLVIANIMAAGLCLVLAKPLAKACFLPFATVVPIIAVLVFVGAYAANSTFADLVLLMGISVVGYSMKRLGWPRPPLILGAVLGEKMETNLWLTWARYGFEWLHKPGVLILLALTILSLAYPFLRKRQDRASRIGGPTR